MVNIIKQLFVALLLTFSAVAVSDIKKGSQIEQFLTTIATKEAALCTFELFADAAIDPATATAQFNTYITADQRAQIKLVSEEVKPTSEVKPVDGQKVIQDEGKDVVVDANKPASKEVVVEPEQPAHKKHHKKDKHNKKDEEIIVAELDVAVVEEDANKVNQLAIKDADGKVHPKSADLAVVKKNTEPVVVKDKSDKILTAGKPLTQKLSEALHGEKSTTNYAIVIECFTPKAEKGYKQFNYTGLCNAPDNKLTVYYRKHVENNTVENTSITIDVQQVSQLYSLLEEMKFSDKTAVSFDSNKCEIHIDWAAITAVFVGVLALLY